MLEEVAVNPVPHYSVLLRPPLTQRFANVWLNKFHMKVKPKESILLQEEKYKILNIYFGRLFFSFLVFIFLF